ncbi:MAG: hypothetical protein ACREQV_18600 [Candidatus Binatia bacterium]
MVENMTGAGSLIAANYTFNSAKPDGLFVGIWNSALVLRQALGDKAMRFDARKFGWVGAPTIGTPHCSIMTHTGLKTLKDVLATKSRDQDGLNRTWVDLRRYAQDIEPDHRDEVQSGQRL